MRVLHVIGAMDRGGAETFIMNVYRVIDRSKIQFDFLVHEYRCCDFDDEIAHLGGHIYRIPRFTGANIVRYRLKCRDFFAEHDDYAAVHGHIGSSAAIYLSEAKKAGLFTIAHSHNTRSKGIQQRLFDFVSYPTRYIADSFLACSREAGVDRFGSRIVGEDKFRVVNNGILLDQYRFCEHRRNSFRRGLGIDDEVPVFCHIGRFAPQKNHRFLIEVFSEIVRSLPSSQLLLVGRGPLEDMVRATAASMGLSDRIKFLGVRDDIPDILMCSDVFLFPSKWEGLGIAAIEAQATGLPCILSSSLPTLSVINENVRCLSVEGNAEAWASAAIAMLNQNEAREKQVEHVREAGFDISDTAGKLIGLYANHRLWED